MKPCKRSKVHVQILNSSQDFQDDVLCYALEKEKKRKTLRSNGLSIS